MAKKKRKDVLDKISSFFMDKLENATLEEFVFLLSWIAGTYIAFDISQKTLGLIKVKQPGKYTEIPTPEALQDRLGPTITLPAMEPLLENPMLLAIAVVASYKFLKSDIGSIGAILGLLK